MKEYVVRAVIEAEDLTAAWEKASRLPRDFSPESVKGLLGLKEFRIDEVSRSFKMNTQDEKENNQ